MSIPKYIKNEPCTCPLCGEEGAVQYAGFEDGCAYEKLRCPYCDIEWEETYAVMYCGYNCKDENGLTILYNDKGEEI